MEQTREEFYRLVKEEGEEIQKEQERKNLDDIRKFLDAAGS